MTAFKSGEVLVPNPLEIVITPWEAGILWRARPWHVDADSTTIPRD